MNGTIAQLVSLVTYGNAYLKNTVSVEELNLYNSTFIYSSKVEFIDHQKGLWGTKEINSGADPQEWFKYLKTQNCTTLKLYYGHSQDQTQFEDHMTSAFVGGGGVWLIESAHGNGEFKYWAGKWEVTNKEAPDNRIWRITYYNSYSGKESQLPQFLPLLVAKENLLSTLKRAYDFSVKNDTGFTPSFENAIKNIDDPAPQILYYKDLTPTNSLSLIHQQLLCAAAASWVFGGMGSWNDLGFADEESQAEYKIISQTLYDDAIAAIISAVNS